MSSITLFYIILAGILALAIALFQYYKNKKSMSVLNMLFSFFRFISLFSILLLLINPKFQQVKISIEKPNLVIAVDNSNSMEHLGQSKKVSNLVENLTNNQDLKEKFNLQFYSFGAQLKSLDHLTFDEYQTNINASFNQLSQVYKQTIAPTIVITDGNQTYGSDYAYSHYKQPIYPVICGDTINYVDLKIEQLNVNKYAYLKNKFPVEGIFTYNGDVPITSKFVVTNGSAVVYSETINFSKSNNSKTLHFSLPANSVGVHVYKATLEPLKSEINTVNNSKNFAVEVIDQKTKIALVSEVIHPDLGGFKKSIESNEQRFVTILTVNDAISQINDFQLFILYQPNYKFSKMYDALNAENKNRFVVVGTKTDLNFLNKINLGYTYEITNQTESYQAAFNRNYTPFLIDDLDFESFPPLNTHYGMANFSVPFETILTKTVNGISKNSPLLATFETGGRREAVLFGENIWQWRAQSYLNSKSFQGFDDFIGKLIQYLGTNKLKSRLNVDYQSFYYGNSNVIISAEFFDKNYIFDGRESLKITVKDTKSDFSKTFPLILNTSNYQVDLSSLPPTEYNFTVSATNEKITSSGQFKLLEYNVEQQFLNADVLKLQQLAANTSGKSYFVDHTENLVNDLLHDERFVTIQKSHKNSLPLIDWKYLLIIIAVSLSVEWFLRKYNGLI